MDTWIQALVMGIVQGLTEFLPISSSGHLIIVPWLFGWDDFDSDSVQKAFDVALHIGTLAAVCIYFRHDLALYIRDGWRALRSRGRRVTPEGRLAWLLLLATVPAVRCSARCGPATGGRHRSGDRRPSLDAVTRGRTGRR